MDSAWFQPLQAGIVSTSVEENQVSFNDVDNPDPIQPEGTPSTPSNPPRDLQILWVDSMRAQSSLINQYEQRHSTQHNAKKDDAKKELLQMFETLEESLETNPEVFMIPIRAFTSQFSKITTQSHLVSALHTFGKYNGAATTAKRVCKKARRQALQFLHRSWYNQLL